MKSNKTAAVGTICDRNYWREKGSWGGLIIHPPSKFAFCMLAKNGCSQWSTVIAKLYHNNLNINVPHYLISEKSLDKYGIEGVESIFSDPAATKVVMLRDPLARFVSAYLDKCFEYNCGAMQCSGIRKHAGKKQGERVTFHEARRGSLIRTLLVLMVTGNYNQNIAICALISTIIQSLVEWRRKLIHQTQHV